MKYLILGRTAAGKDWLANLLEKEMGLKQLISYTDRPRRPGEGDTHIFCDSIHHNFRRLSEKDPFIIATVNGVKHEFHDSEIIANTTIDHYCYFATVEQFNDCDIYILDPIGLDNLFEFWEDYGIEKEFRIIYVYAGETTRKQRYAKRNNVSSFRDYLKMDSRFKHEDYEFKEFEEKLKDYYNLHTENMDHYDVLVVNNGGQLVYRMTTPHELVEFLKYHDKGNN